VADAKHPKRLSEEPGDIAGAVVGHHPLDPDAARSEPAERPLSLSVEFSLIVGIENSLVGALV